jgi:hypothetical protein
MSHRTCVAQYLSDPTTRQRYVVLDEMFCSLRTKCFAAQDTVLTWEHLPMWPSCALDEYLTLTAVLAFVPSGITPKSAHHAPAQAATRRCVVSR